MLVLVMAVVFGVGLAGIVDPAGSSSVYPNFGMHSCEDRLPFHDHDRLCHSVARHQTPAASKTKRKPPQELGPRPALWLVQDCYDCEVDQRPFGRKITPRPGAKTAFRDVFRGKRVLLL